MFVLVAASLAALASGALAAYELLAVSGEMKGLRSGLTHLERSLASLDEYVRSL